MLFLPYCAFSALVTFLAFLVRVKREQRERKLAMERASAQVGYMFSSFFFVVNARNRLCGVCSCVHVSE